MAYAPAKEAIKRHEKIVKEREGKDYIPPLSCSARCLTAAGEDGSGIDLTKGVWFQATASGLWYKNHESAGAIRAVLVNGRSYFKHGA